MINVELDSAAVKTAISRTAKVVGNFRPVLNRIGLGWRALVDLSFRRGISPNGDTWHPIMRAGQILIDTGRLRASIDHEATEKELNLGSNVEYAAAHQFGAEGPVQVPAHNRRITQAFGRRLAFPVFQNVSAHVRQQNMPARPYVPVGVLPQNYIDSALKVTQNVIAEAMAG